MKVSQAIVPLLFTLISAFQDPIYHFLQVKSLVPVESWAVFFFLYGVVAPVLVMAVVDGGFARIIDELGLAKPMLPALVFGFFVTLPAFVGFLVTSRVNTAVAPREILMGGAFFPLVEETFFRSFLFGQLYRRAGWNFWPAALVPAVVFALGHLYQSQDPTEIAGILAITGSGAIIFSYVLLQWGGNIWAPFACHAFLNTWWSLFAIDDTALGDQTANIFRFASIFLAVGFCAVAPRFGWLTPLKRTEPAVPS